nr:hypothetical protein Iba_chr14bCG16310 [Ipomoea batatas]
MAQYLDFSPAGAELADLRVCEESVAISISLVSDFQQIPKYFNLRRRPVVNILARTSVSFFQMGDERSLKILCDIFSKTDDHGSSGGSRQVKLRGVICRTGQAASSLSQKNGCREECESCVAESTLVPMATAELLLSCGKTEVLEQGENFPCLSRCFFLLYSTSMGFSESSRGTCGLDGRTATSWVGICEDNWKDFWVQLNISLVIVQEPQLVQVNWFRFDVNSHVNYMENQPNPAILPIFGLEFMTLEPNYDSRRHLCVIYYW